MTQNETEMALKSIWMFLGFGPGCTGAALVLALAFFYRRLKLPTPSWIKPFVLAKLKWSEVLLFTFCGGIWSALLYAQFPSAPGSLLVSSGGGWMILMGSLGTKIWSSSPIESIPSATSPPATKSVHD